MTSQPVYAGVDISKHHIDVAIAPQGDRLAIPATDLDRLVAWLVRRKPRLVVVEATGGYERDAVSALVAAGLSLAVVNPRQVRNFARAAGRLAKTDRIDADVLAAFGLAIKPEPRPLLDEQAHALRDLVVRRRQLLEMRKAEKTRSEMRLSAAVQAGLERHLAWLDSEIASADDDLDHMIRQSPAWRADEELFRSVPGVGPTRAPTLSSMTSRKRTRMLAPHMPATWSWGRGCSTTMWSSMCRCLSPTCAAATPRIGPASRRKRWLTPGTSWRD